MYHLPIVDQPCVCFAYSHDSSDVCCNSHRITLTYRKKGRVS